MLLAIDFPNLSPEVFAIDFGSFRFALRWYALGYIIGILAGWWIIGRAIARPALFAGQSPMTKQQLEELVTWMVIGIILGGRLGFVLFYQPGYYLQNPGEIVKLWEGGMAFHGGFLGVVIAAWVFSRRHGLPTASVADLLAVATPPALGLVRIANFVNAELWGRPTDAPWGVIFPGPAAQSCATADAPCARHPSQLYEAGLEGLLLGTLLLTLAFRAGWLKRPGLLAGTFFTGYGLSRFIVEFFRQADAQFISPDNPWGHVFAGMTMGQLLSLPMILAGVATMIWALRRSPA
ncbi:MAG: prolipoprotein diacylglyceryl transferase [Rhodobacterales bacterium]|nr:MAG: prolipoprotein diacylglyceryl transferase [Rhodobacterales bacterium]